MLPKANRVTTRAVEQIFKSGRSINSPRLTFKFIKEGHGGVRVSFVAPKAIAKGAVKRNLLRRRGYTSVRKYLARFPAGLSGVFVFKKELEKEELENEIENILNKIN